MSKKPKEKTPKINIVWDTDAQSIRGSFVNLVITIAILGLFIAGAFNDDVAARLDKISGAMVGFFTASMGIWSLKQVQERAAEAKVEEKRVEAGMPATAPEGGSS